MPEGSGQSKTESFDDSRLLVSSSTFDDELLVVLTEESLFLLLRLPKERGDKEETGFESTAPLSKPSPSEYRRSFLIASSFASILFSLVLVSRLSHGLKKFVSLSSNIFLERWYTFKQQQYSRLASIPPNCNFNIFRFYLVRRMI